MESKFYQNVLLSKPNFGSLLLIIDMHYAFEILLKLIKCCYRSELIVYMRNVYEILAIHRRYNLCTYIKFINITVYQQHTLIIMFSYMIKWQILNNKSVIQTLFHNHIGLEYEFLRSNWKPLYQI